MFAMHFAPSLAENANEAVEGKERQRSPEKNLRKSILSGRKKL